MKRLKELLWGWDPAPPTWQATVRLGLILVVVETLVCLAFIKLVGLA